MIRPVLALVLLATTGKAAELYRVAGVVVNAATNAPLPHARVVLFRADSPEVVGAMVTGDNGRFSFDAPRGKFRLMAGSRVGMNSFGMRRSDSLGSTAVVTGPGQATASIVFRWFPLAAISGRVVDQYGEPAESAIVQLVFSGVIAGRVTVNSRGFARTDDRGEYRFGPLPGGTYYLVVSGEPRISRIASVANVAQAEAYAAVFSGNAGDASRAAPILLKPGEEARAEFTVAAVPGSTLVIHHDAPEGVRGTVALLMDGVGGAEGYQRTESIAYGREMRLAGVPPGRYVLRMSGMSGATTVGATRDVLVSGAETSVELHVRPLATLSGRVELEDPRAPRRGSLYVRLTRAGRGIQAMVRPDGSFSFPAVATGKWRPGVGSLDGHFATQTRVDGAEYRDSEIDVREGLTISLQMTASTGSGIVRGFVLQEERAIEGVMVVLAPARDSADPSQYRGFQTDSDGSFDFRGVPPGDYLLFAVADTEIEYGNAGVVSPYRAAAKPVRVNRGEVVEQQIPITPAASK